MTGEDYLAFERAADERHEFRNGEIIGMTGTRRAHNIISTNISGILWNHLKGKACETYAGDMRVYMPLEDLCTYPDVVVVCGKPEFQDEVFDTLLNPIILIEILSDTTEAYDRGDKSLSFRKIASLREYLLVSQDRMQIEKYTGHGDGFWMLTDASGDDAEVVLESIGCTLSLAEIYDKVDFTAAAEATPDTV